VEFYDQQRAIGYRRIAAENAQEIINGVVVVCHFEADAYLRPSASCGEFVDEALGGGQVKDIESVAQARGEGADRAAGCRLPIAKLKG